jgi:hypothetical protein
VVNDEICVYGGIGKEVYCAPEFFFLKVASSELDSLFSDLPSARTEASMPTTSVLRRFVTPQPSTPGAAARSLVEPVPTVGGRIRPATAPRRDLPVVMQPSAPVQAGRRPRSAVARFATADLTVTGSRSGALPPRSVLSATVSATPSKADEYARSLERRVAQLEAELTDARRRLTLAEKAKLPAVHSNRAPAASDSPAGWPSLLPLSIANLHSGALNAELSALWLQFDTIVGSHDAQSSTAGSLAQWKQAMLESLGRSIGSKLNTPSERSMEESSAVAPSDFTQPSEIDAALKRMDAAEAIEPEHRSPTSALRREQLRCRRAELTAMLMRQDWQSEAQALVHASEKLKTKVFEVANVWDGGTYQLLRELADSKPLLNNPKALGPVIKRLQDEASRVITVQGDAVAAARTEQRLQQKHLSRFDARSTEMTDGASVQLHLDYISSLEARVRALHVELEAAEAAIKPWREAAGAATVRLLAMAAGRENDERKLKQKGRLIWSLAWKNLRRQKDKVILTIIIIIITIQ